MVFSGGVGRIGRRWEVMFSRRLAVVYRRDAKGLHLCWQGGLPTASIMGFLEGLASRRQVRDGAARLSLRVT